MYSHISKIYFCFFLVAIVVVGSSAGRKIRIKLYDDDDRITNGQNTTIANIPYIVQIVKNYSSGDGDGFICGGTLISDRHVVSAAHCFFHYNAADIAIVANATYLRCNEGAIRRDVDAIYMYDSVTDGNDIAVIKLSEPLTFGKGVQKAKMCDDNWKGKEKIIVAGWGATVQGANCSSNQLQIIKLNTLSSSACESYAGITPRMICSVVNKGKDACQVDSGGPAFYKGKFCGVISFGFGCGNNGEPGVFASIPKHREFINISLEKL